jgi:hypothetical protein
MRICFNPMAAMAAFVVGAIALFAQWPSYPTGVPKAADGKPDLTAATPHAADGHPDLSGTWELMRPPGGRGPAGAGRGKETTPPPPPPPPVLPADGSPPLATFQNIGRGFPDGLPLRPWAADLLKARKSENSKDNPDAHCLPLGLMQLHMHPQPRKIIQTPNLIVMLYEAQGGVRQIFMDGRPLPPADVQPWWYGYSIGHWDGDTLVVETTGFRDDVWLDIDGSPLTNSGKMTERMRRLNYGTLQTDVTIEDAKTYTKPFTVRVQHRLMPDTDLFEFICNENEKSDAHLVGK